jgi:hypothetical protein
MTVRAFSDEVLDKSVLSLLDSQVKRGATALSKIMTKFVISLDTADDLNGHTQKNLQLLES